MSYQLTLSDNAYNVIKLLMETRLNYFKQNVSAYVERVIEYEEILDEYNKAVHLKDPKPTVEQKTNKAKAKPVPPNLCKTHPNYGAKRAPRSLDCDSCWAAYKKYNGQDAAKRAKLKLSRKDNGKAT